MTSDNPEITITDGWSDENWVKRHWQWLFKGPDNMSDDNKYIAREQDIVDTPKATVTVGSTDAGEEITLVGRIENISDVPGQPDLARVTVRAIPDIRPELRRVLPLLKRIANQPGKRYAKLGTGIEGRAVLIDDPDNRKLAEFIEAAEALLLEE